MTATSIALATELESFKALLRDTRAHEARCGVLVDRALSTPPPGPDDDTLDADEDSLAPPPPSHHRTRTEHT